MSRKMSRHVVLPIDFAKLIAEESAKIEELRAQVHRTFLQRDRDEKSRDEWGRACREFHSYESRLNPYLERARQNARYVQKNLLEFVVCFLEVDPWFFGSGYLKELFLTRLKRSDLDDAIKERLRAVMVDAVERRGTREFKYYCRLAAVIGGESLVSSLEKASASTDGAVARRAKRMLETIRQRQRSRPSCEAPAGEERRRSSASARTPAHAEAQQGGTTRKQPIEPSPPESQSHVSVPSG